MRTNATKNFVDQTIDALSNNSDTLPEKEKDVYTLLENVSVAKDILESELNKKENEIKPNKGKNCIQSFVNTLCGYIGAYQVFIGRMSESIEGIVEIILSNDIENADKIKHVKIEGTPFSKCKEIDMLVCTEAPLKSFPGLTKITSIEPKSLIQYVHKKSGAVCLALFNSYAMDVSKTEEVLESFIPEMVNFVNENENINNIEQSLARYKHIVETLSEYIVINKIENGKVINISHSDICQKVTGYSMEDYKNDPDLWLKMVYEADKRYVTEQLNKIIFGIEVKAFEHRIYHKNGTVRWIRNTPVLFYNAMHQPVEYVAIINDISELKQVELKMIESEKHYKMLFNEMNSGFGLHEMIYDENGNPADYRFIEVNLAYERLTGLKREAIIGKRLLEILPGIDKEWIMRYGQVVKTGIPETFVKYEPLFDRHYEVVAYSPDKDLFAVVFNDVSDRVKAREQLEERENRYRSIVELSPDAIVIFANEEIVYANNKAANLFGFCSAQQMQGRNVKEFFRNAYIDEVKLNVVKEFEEKLPGRLVEEQIKKQDGTLVEVEISAAPVFLGKKTIQLIIRDISQRKRTEAALIRSEERFLMAMDAVNDGVFEWDLKANEVYYSPRNYNMLGYEVNEFEPKHAVWESMIHEEDKANNLAEFQRHLRGESEMYELEYRVRTKSGQYKWISERGKILERDKTGNPIRIIGIHSDIDARKAMEENLRNEAEFINNLMNIAPVGIFIVTVDGKIPFANDLAIQMIRLKPGQDGYYNVPQYKVYDSDGKEVNFQDLPIYNAFKSMTSALHQRFWYESEGKKIFVETNMRPSVSLYQKKEGFIIVVSDITNQIDAENKLRQAKEKAEESDRLKSAFLANMSHEIRTPMNGIIGFSTLLAKPDLTQDKRDNYLNIVQNSANQLLSIINDILDISKIEAGQMQIDHSHLKLNDLLDSLHLQFIKEKKDKGKEHVGLFLKKGLLDEASHIISDKIRIGQILSNLLGNAIKFTEKGSIEFGYTINNNKWIEFYIRDTGIGIPAEKGKLIFERFRQIDETTARTYGGTGLGLSISKGIVDLMKGKIWFEYEIGVGTVFYFTVPYNPLKNVQQTETVKLVSADENHSLEGYEVLVVEDVPENFYLLREILEEAGAHILYASDGKTGLSILKNTEKIDFILLDIRLPDISGYDLARQMRKEKPDVPIIAQTAYGLSGDREKALAAGCVDYISKPIVADELMKVIKRNITPKQ
ncbi:MAG TPA: PAS domain S-box protein [Bacteroidales bacterium]|nr:PAS domain S-box protein [Bacteroidales bacterium]